MVFQPGRSLAVYGVLLLLITGTLVKCSSSILVKRVCQPTMAERIPLALSRPADPTLVEGSLHVRRSETEFGMSSGPIDQLQAYHNGQPNFTHDGHGGYFRIVEETNNNSQIKPRESGHITGNGNGVAFKLDQGMAIPPPRNKKEERMVTFEHFMTTIKSILKLDSNLLVAGQLDSWLQLSLVKRNPGPLLNLSDLIDHTLEFIKIALKSEYAKLSKGRSDEEIKYFLMKQCGKMTLEEGIELFHPGTPEDQKKSMRIFALGLLAFNKNLSSTEHSWSAQDLQELLRRWNRFSGPDRKPTWISWSEFDGLVVKVVGFHPEKLEELRWYLKHLMLWEIGDENQKLPLEELVHHTLLWGKENDVFLFNAHIRDFYDLFYFEDLLSKGFMRHITTNRNLDKKITSLGIKLSKEKQDSFKEFIKIKLQTGKPNFDLGNVGLKQWEFLFEDWKKSTGQTTLETQPPKGEEKTNAMFDTPKLDQPIGTDEHMEEIENPISFRYFIILSRRVLDLDIKALGHLETSLIKFKTAPFMNVSKLLKHTLDWLRDNFESKYIELLKQKSEVDIRNDFKKNYNNPTFDEILEFHLPETSEKERLSMRKFVLGLSAVDGNKPAGYQWNSENAQELFRHWNKVSGPEKESHLISLRNFNEIVPNIFGVPPESVISLNKYFKNLILWEMKNEKEEISLQELIHYTLLWIKVDNVECKWHKSDLQTAMWHIEKRVYNYLCKIRPHLSETIASLEPDFSIDQKREFLLYLETEWVKFAFYQDSLKPDYLKGWIEDWKTNKDKTNSERVHETMNPIGNHEAVYPFKMDPMISVKRFGIVGCCLYLEKYPDFIEFLQKLSTVETMKFLDLITHVANWLKSKGEFGSPSIEYISAQDWLDLKVKFALELNKLSVEDYFKLHPDISHQKKSFWSFISKRLKTNTDSDLWDLDKVEKLHEEWKTRSKWSAWWENLKSKIYKLWRKLMESLKGSSTTGYKSPK
ncbi:hypothetical protein PGT21_033922 [Puccinia graminis f. sp. tritici]|uniref:Uncharacterized protein n=1 Tax=Puccinia graminis f. sp. tritici TaxID=56615 RepID=A0A5B0NEC8_PUCGR|nr:hypothetical protein PGT21_033922 [Puccinia graminis f. sp. tritici]